MLSGNPVDLLSYLFNPIFQTMFLLLIVFYSIFGDIGIAIILLTLLIKTVLIPLFRAQIVSQRRMQMIQPEVKAIQTKYKGNRAKISEETMRLYRERGVSLGSGCLPTFLQLFLLLPIYSVISQGLAAPDISSALQFLGQPVLQDFACQAPGTLQPCIDPTIAWLGNLDAHIPEILFTIPGINFGVSLLALLAAGLQLIQTRMMTPPTDRSAGPGATTSVPDHPLVLDHLWFVPTGRPIPVLDRIHGVFDRAAISDRRVGFALPAFRMDPWLCRESHAAFPD